MKASQVRVGMHVKINGREGTVKHIWKRNRTGVFGLWTSTYYVFDLGWTKVQAEIQSLELQRKET